MAIKWSKKICVQYIREMRSAIEEEQQKANLPQSGEGSLMDRLRALKNRVVTGDGKIPPMEM